jgi:hypothetical protein
MNQGRPDNESYLVGPTIDMFLGFLLGFFLIVFGLLATIVAMYIWAGGASGAESALRRRHAARVVISAAFGLAAAFVLLLMVVIAVPGQ